MPERFADIVRSHGGLTPRRSLDGMPDVFPRDIEHAAHRRTQRVGHFRDAENVPSKAHFRRGRISGTRVTTTVSIVGPPRHARPAGHRLVASPMSLADFQPVFLALETRGEVVVARLTRTHLSEEDNIEQMARELVMLIDQYGCRQLVLSFAAVEFVTSAALGKVIMVHRRLRREGGRMVVCAVHGTVAEVLHASRLDEYFRIAADDAAAVSVLNATATSAGEG